MEQFFVFIYPAVMVISIFGYLPQIRSLLFAKSRPDNISLTCWMTWCISSFLAFGYSVSHLHDNALSLSTGLNFFMIVITTLLIVYNKHLRFSTKRIPGLSPIIPVKIKNRIV